MLKLFCYSLLQILSIYKGKEEWNRDESSNDPVIWKLINGYLRDKREKNDKKCFKCFLSTATAKASPNAPFPSWFGTM